MRELLLLIDGSVNPQSKIGYGAYLALLEPELSLDELKLQVKVRRFEQTSSTKLELQTLLWALTDIKASARKLVVYTDSQNIIGLAARRDQLEKNNGHTNKKTRTNNYALYQEFFHLTDQLECQFVKVRGHQQAKGKDKVDNLFTLVDRAARKALRESLL
ncbi:MAG: ribonuclease H [Deltaproteobacteria bacterium]|jgi:ribonuclease HI|nr:ribonuclease H [Deltaproteobacteria bacterium]